jgi:amidase
VTAAPRTIDAWVVRLQGTGGGPRVAVKDAIDVLGLPTRVGSLATSDRPAAADAACVAEVRRNGGRIVGKTTLTELCWYGSGVNDVLGTPVNPVDPALAPGGSSSGSAVVVARGEADVALGTDTGGSVRIPAACCGIAALKTSWGRIPLRGVYPLAPSYDTVGPLARDVAGLVLGMRLLEPGFDPRPPGRPVVARIRPAADPRVDAAVDAALAATGWEIVERPVPWWAEVGGFGAVIDAEGARANVELPRHLLSGRTREAVDSGLRVSRERLMELRAGLAGVQLRFLRLLDGVDALALPTLDRPTPRLDSGDLRMTRLTFPVNAARLPAVSVPIPGASLQLVGRPYAEETLLGLLDH